MAEAPEDNWANRESNMVCKTCLYFARKDDKTTGRCRRHAPTIKGFVPVYPTDWCGDHRVRD